MAYFLFSSQEVVMFSHLTESINEEYSVCLDEGHIGEQLMMSMKCPFWV